MTDRQLRALRGVSASVVATLLAAVSHTVGGGEAPAPVLVIAMAVVLALPAMLLMGARRSTARLVVTVCSAQAAFHASFFALGSPAGTGISTAHAGQAGHVHGDVLTAVLGETGGAALAPDGIMLLAHTVAALGTVALLHRGEGLVRAIASWASAVVARVADASPALPAVPPLRGGTVVRRVRTFLSCGLPPLRGPPSFLLAVTRPAFARP